MARPSKFKQEYVAQAAKLCLLGATDAQLADFFGVSEQTLNAWKQQFPEFLESLKESKSEADREVERSLFHRAKGYSHAAVKIFCDKFGGITEVPYTEHYPPDTTACIFWLKNRDKENWRDKQDIEHSGGTTTTLQFTDKPPTAEEFMLLYAPEPEGKE